jgi:HAD superfamily hydrolase (TIGR01458 family)
MDLQVYLLRGDDNHRKMQMESIKGIIFDIDGVLEYQGQVIPGAIEVLEELRSRNLVLRFLTNSTLKSRVSAAEKLRKKGFVALDAEIITASYATADYLRGLKPRSIWLMLDREGRDEFLEFVHDEDHPEYIVVGDYRSRFDFDHLNRALRLLVEGARLIGMQNELTDGSFGELELNVGSWVEMLERASGVQAVYIGKPFPYAFQLAMRSLGLSQGEVLVVGDRVSTDILGAKNAGLRSALVKTGEFRPADLQVGIQPDWVLGDIRELLALLLD